MPSNIIPDQSANTNEMLDGNILHGEEASLEKPYLKETFEAIINNTNTLASESDVSNGATKVGVKTSAFTNFTKATNDVAAALEGIDTAIGSAVAGGRQEFSFAIKYPFKQPLAIQSIVRRAGTLQSIYAYMAVDAGVLVDSMDSITGWSVAEAAANLALESDNYREGSGAVTFDKNSSNVLARIYKTFTSFNGTNSRVRMDVYLPDITDFSAVRVFFLAMQA